MTKQNSRLGIVVGAALAATLSGAVACGDDFNGDCHASHTCTEDSTSGTTAGGAAGQGNDANNGGTGETTNAGGTNPNSNAGSNEGGSSAATSGGTAGTGTEAPGGAGAGGQAGNAPPTITSVSPADQADDAAPATDIVITFSEPLDPATVTSESVKLLDGTTPISGKLVYADDKATFTPDVPLFMLEPYEVSVSTAVTDLEGAPLATAFTSTFTTRDGIWKTIDAAQDDVVGIADGAPITATGSVLLAWNGAASAACPVSAQWFRLGATSGDPKVFDAADTACSNLTVAGTSDGIGAVVWQVPKANAGVLAQQFRSGAWLAKPAVVSSDADLGAFRLAASPNGMLSLIAHNFTGVGRTTAWRTDAAGKWVATPDVLSTTEYGANYYGTSLAFDAAGNGLAVWKAQSAANPIELLYSRYTVASGKWSTAKPIASSTFAAAAELSAPALSVSSSGDAIAVWVEKATQGGTLLIRASAFSATSGAWTADAQSLAGPLSASLSLLPPAIAFDGQTFVAAWTGNDPFTTGLCASQNCTYTSRFNTVSGHWAAPLTQQTTNDDLSAQRMPRLLSDGRGNLMLLWVKSAGNSTYSLLFQRYVGGDWGGIDAVPGGSVGGDQFASYAFYASMNASGMAAVYWTNYAGAPLRLASFF